LNADFHGPENNQRFGPSGAQTPEKPRLGVGEPLILFRPLDAKINAEVIVDD
jgi:hypothetical protein